MIFILALLLVCAGSLAEAENRHGIPPLPLDSTRRPLYNIAHMCNTIRKTLDGLNRGANAVEVDVNFRDDDIYLYHGYPCDCFRFCWDTERLSTYLQFINHVTNPNSMEYKSYFTILYFDLKLKNMDDEKKYQKGVQFAECLSKYFFKNQFPIPNTIRFIAAISYADDAEFLNGFIQRLKSLGIYEATKNFIGYDIGIEKDTDRIRDIWKQLNITNVWQGEGITNCINPILGHQLESLVEIRDGSHPYFTKVYRWTIDLTQSIRSVLQYRIDGIMTNHPERIVRIVRDDPDFSKEYRLATIYDDPFQRHQSQEGPGRKSATIPLRSGYGGQKVLTVLRDVKDSLTRLVREVFISLF